MTNEETNLITIFKVKQRDKENCGAREDLFLTIIKKQQKIRNKKKEIILVEQLKV